MTVASQIGRIDIIRHGKPPQGESSPPVLEDLSKAINDAAKQLALLLSIAPIFRVGIVAALNVEAKESFSKGLSDVTDMVRFPDNAIDCVYQFNVRRKSKANGNIELNRLTTWATGEQSLLMFNFGGGNPSPSASPMTVKSIPIVNFNIDVNTFTNPSSLLGASDAGLIEELAAEVMTIANNGPAGLQ